MTFQIKICGLTDPDIAGRAVEAGATMIGLVFCPPSPRHVTIDLAADIAAVIGSKAALVGLFVDPQPEAVEDLLDAVALTHVQLHGGEGPGAVAALSAVTGLPVFKALPVAVTPDLDLAADFALCADGLILDAKPPAGADYPGGHGVAFDWRVLAGFEAPLPWLLSGGLTPESVADGIRACRDLPNFAGVDVSSGVEAKKGVKDMAKINAFIAAARAALIESS